MLLRMMDDHAVVVIRIWIGPVQNRDKAQVRAGDLFVCRRESQDFC